MQALNTRQLGDKLRQKTCGNASGNARDNDSNHKIAIEISM
jgi:hypothetical protein